MIKHIIKLIWNKKSNNALMLLEIFLSFLVLFAALSYVIYNTDRLEIPIGFEAENKLAIYLEKDVKADSTEVADTRIRLEKALSEMDNVISVGTCNSVSPYSRSTWQSGDDAQGFNISSRYVYADEDFQKTMKIRMLEGRWFKEAESDRKGESIVVNKRFVDEYFPGVSMIDSIIQFNGDRKIIGVMEDYRYNGQFEEPTNTLFFYQPETHMEAVSVLLDMEPNTPAAYEEEINEVVQDITKSTSFVIQDVSVLRKRANADTWFSMIALIVISGFLCINVALGLFGVLWYTINKRRSEIGLRRALGAHSTNIASQFTLEILILSSLAILAGVLIAVQVPLMKLLPLDSSVFYRAIVFAILIILGIVTICAVYPSYQASKIHPAMALHED